MRSSNRVSSTTTIQELFCLGKPEHPLITFIEVAEIMNYGLQVKTDFYVLANLTNPSNTQTIMQIFLPEDLLDFSHYEGLQGEIIFISKEYFIHYEPFLFCKDKLYNKGMITYSSKKFVKLFDQLKMEVNQNLDIYSNELIYTIIKNILLELKRLHILVCESR